MRERRSSSDQSSPVIADAPSRGLNLVPSGTFNASSTEEDISGALTTETLVQ
jgi:hypothetical protein